MTAKQYLRQLRKLERNILILTEEIEQRRSSLTSTSAPIAGDKVQTSPGGDRFADLIAALADIELQQETLIGIYHSMRAEMVSQILSLDNDMQVTVLRSRYLLGKSLRIVAQETHYSYERICHIHGEALAAFTKKYPGISQL